MGKNDVFYSALREFLFIMFVLTGITAGGTLFGLGFSQVSSINFLNPNKHFIAIEEGCNITSVVYKFLPEKELESRRHNRCADYYSYTFSVVTDPQVSYLDEETKVK